MEPERMRWMEVQRVGAATPCRRHGHRYRWRKPARLAEQITHRLLGHQWKVAGEKQRCIRAVLDCTSEAALSSDVLPFLARLDQNLSAQLRSQRGRLVAAGHDQAMFSGPCSANRARRVATSQRPPLGWIEGGTQSLLGGIEVFDQDHHPGAHALPHLSRIRGRIFLPYRSRNRAWSLPGEWNTRWLKPSSRYGRSCSRCSSGSSDTSQR